MHREALPLGGSGGEEEVTVTEDLLKVSVVEDGDIAGEDTDTVEEVAEGEVEDEDGGAAPQPAKLMVVPEVNDPFIKTEASSLSMT